MSIIIKLGTLFLNIVYACMKLFPVKNQIVMISRQSNDATMDFQLLKAALHKEDPTLSVVLLCKTLDGGVQSTLMDKISYIFHMFTQMYYLARSKAVILDGYCIVVSLLHHRSKLTVFQIWHSIGTMKKFGYTALGTAEGSKRSLATSMHMHRNYDYAFASSPLYSLDLAKGFQCDPNIVKIYPLPRVDLLRDQAFKMKKRDEILRAYPILKDKQVIVYVPTFRKDESGFQEAFDRLCANLKENQIMVIKPHPLTKIKISNPMAIMDTKFTSFDMLFVADAVISDYSCIIYEAGLAGVPLYFYNYDMDQYVDKRGLAIDYEHELPGVISKDANVIMSAIDGRSYDMEKLNTFIKKYVVCDGNASLNMANFILSHTKEGDVS